MDDGLDPGSDVEGMADAEQALPEDLLQEDVATAEGVIDPSVSAVEDAAADNAAAEDAKETAGLEGNLPTSETDATCKRLLARYEAVGHALAAFGHPHTPLLQAVELVEALLQDFEQRATVEVEADRIAESQRRERQPHLIRQLTFYFSDANLRHDKFLRQRIEEDGAGLGYVDIDLLLSFNRVKQIGCTTALEMAAAVEAAPASAGLELSAPRTAIRRRGGAPMPPLTSIADAEEPSMKDQCTVRIERLPKNEGVDADALSKLCASYGEVVHVWLVHTSKGEPEFTGVAEVEFRAKDAADAAVAAQPPLEWSGSSLLLKSLVDFRAERSQQRGMKRPLPNDGANESAKRSRIEKEAVDSAARFDRGAILRLDDVPSAVGWMDIKDAFVEYGEVVYVDTEVQNKSHKAYVRMRDSEGAAAAIKGLAGSGGFIWFEVPENEEDAAAKKSEDKKNSTPIASSADKVAEDVAAPPASDPYGGQAEEATAVPKSDPYGGGDEAGGAAEEKASEAAETDPFVVDTEGSAVVDMKEDKVAEEVNKAVDADSEKTQTYRVAVVLLDGDEEEAYIQKMALALAERRAKVRAKGGKDGKDGKDGKAGKRDKGGKGSRGGKEGKGKGKKGGKDGKHKSGKRAKGDDSGSE